MVNRTRQTVLRTANTVLQMATRLVPMVEGLLHHPKVHLLLRDCSHEEVLRTMALPPLRVEVSLISAVVATSTKKASAEGGDAAVASREEYTEAEAEASKLLP